MYRHVQWASFRHRSVPLKQPLRKLTFSITSVFLRLNVPLSLSGETFLRWPKNPGRAYCKNLKEYYYSRTPLIRPTSESHWCGRIRGMVAREGFVYEQKPLSATRNVVIWEGWSLVRVVVRQGFYCNMQRTWKFNTFPCAYGPYCIPGNCSCIFLLV